MGGAAAQVGVPAGAGAGLQTVGLMPPVGNNSNRDPDPEVPFCDPALEGGKLLGGYKFSCGGCHACCAGMAVFNIAALGYLVFG